MPSSVRIHLPLICLIGLVLGPAQGAALQYEQESDAEPFSYFQLPSTVLGTKDCETLIQIWPASWGKMVFFTGDQPQLLQKRVKTLHRGYLPIIECTDEREGVLYGIQGFATTISGDPEDQLILFIKLSVKNVTDSKRSASFWAGVDYDPIEFTPDRRYVMKKGAATENGEVLYVYDEKTAKGKFAAFGVPYEGPTTAEQAAIVPFVTAMCLTRFDWELQPGETASTTLKAPHVSPVRRDIKDCAIDKDPILSPPPKKDWPSSKTLARQLQKADYDVFFQREVAFWEGFFSEGTQYFIPHKKTSDVMRTSLTYALIARMKIGDNYIQRDSLVQYPQWWWRSVINHQRIYTLYGLPDLTRQCIAYYQDTVNSGTRRIVKSKRAVSSMGSATKPDVYDRFDLNKYGERLWSYCDHYLFTGDHAFAMDVMPEVNGLIGWIEYVIARDELGLIPRCSLWDNEFVWNGHRPGDNFWSLAGLRAARQMGEQLGDQKLVDYAGGVIDKLHPAIMAAVDQAMQQVGRVPAVLEKGRSDFAEGWGEDRENLLMVWPSGALPPDHPAVGATLDRMRSRYYEGVTGNYSDRPTGMFHYRTLWVMQQELTRNRQKHVVEDLYGQLAHAGSTHGGFECAWKSREGYETHGWFWSRYVSMLRNMLIREEWDKTLHLFSAIPAPWARAGNQIGVKDALTYYGNFSIVATIRADGADIEITSDWRSSPTALVLHLPYFAEVSQVLADGKTLPIEGESISLPPDTSSVTLTWQTKPQEMAYTYESYLEEFRKEIPAVRLPYRLFDDLPQRRATWEIITQMTNEWAIIGPFDNTNRKGFYRVYPPETAIDLSQSCTGKDGQKVCWQQPVPPVALIPISEVFGFLSNQRKASCHSGFQVTQRHAAVDFKASLEPDTNATAYAYTNIYSSKKQTVQFVMGSDDTNTLWVNGDKVFDLFNFVRSWHGFITPDTDKIEVTLNQGWNPVLVKVGSIRGGWGFCLRFTDMDGHPIENLRLDPKGKLQ